ncbi:unnamed protein product [Malus baccata var. baccata]
MTVHHLLLLRGADLSFAPLRERPSRVGYGFDRHRLEPRYPLIIDDIDILMTEVGMRIPTGLWASGYHAYSS